MLFVSVAAGRSLPAKVQLLARRVTAAVLVSTLAACGGGGGDGTSFPVLPVAQSPSPIQPDTPPPPAPLTYKLVLANPTVNLQYGQPMTVSATVLASDGTDVTAAATGWSWNSSNSNVVDITPSGATASLLASNNSPTAPVSATITAQATAPNGSTMSGQIAATALPHFTYRVELSATTAKVAADRPATINAKVIRSDGVDVTSASSNWKWTWAAPPAVEGDLILAPNANTTGTFTSNRPDWWEINIVGNTVPRSTPDAGFGVTIQVQADHQMDTVSPALLETTMLARYSFVYEGPHLTPADGVWRGWKLYFEHSSAEGRPVVPCVSSFDLTTIRYSAQTQLLEFMSSQPTSGAVGSSCESSMPPLQINWQVDFASQ